jgi:hypothetical protein
LTCLCNACFSAPYHNALIQSKRSTSKVHWCQLFVNCLLSKLSNQNEAHQRYKDVIWLLLWVLPYKAGVQKQKVCFILFFIYQNCLLGLLTCIYSHCIILCLLFVSNRFCLFIYTNVYLFIQMFIYLDKCLFIYTNVYLFRQMFIYLYKCLFI